MKDDPAFPIEDKFVLQGIHPIKVEGGRGLTKREYFAALAMQGTMYETMTDQYIRNAANNAVRIADALIAELEKK